MTVTAHVIHGGDDGDEPTVLIHDADDKLICAVEMRKDGRAHVFTWPDGTNYVKATLPTEVGGPSRIEVEEDQYR